MQILSYQSAVAFGHVGNSAAVFPLQRLGFDVWPVDTVQFSSHPGYAGWGGDVKSADHLDRVAGGLESLGLPPRLDGVLSGYLGSPEAGEPLVRLLAGVGAGCLYLCDPVMGDDDPGLYVRPGIPELFRDRLIPAAQVITPNRFELEYLSGGTVTDPSSAALAAKALLARGPRLVVVTSLPLAHDTIGTLAVEEDGVWLVATPRLGFTHPPHGTGDVLSALLMGHLLNGRAAPDALAWSVSGLYGVLERTRSLGRRELALAPAQEELVNPTRMFGAAAV